jgi:glycosyltransferase involved in cell wall biosynthesis
MFESTQIRLAVLTNILSPYRIPFFNELARESGIDLKVFYVAEQEKDRVWKTYFDEIRYVYDIIPGIHLRAGGRRTVHINWGVSHRLRKFAPDVVVVGTDLLSTPSSWTALAYARRYRVPLIRFEAHHNYKSDISELKKNLYRYYYRSCRAFFVYSRLTEIYLTTMGIPDERIINGFNVGDTSFFGNQIEHVRSEVIASGERGKYPPVLILFAGELIRRKGFDLLLKAFVEARLHDAALVVLGEGPLRKEAEEFLLNRPNVNIIFLGFKHRDEAVRIFAMADVFVLPSRYDPASIVLSEALHSGLFTIGSIYDGSAWNFIKSKENGIVIDPKNINEFRQALIIAADMIRTSRINRKTIASSMREYTVKMYANRLADLVKKVYLTAEIIA